MRGEISTHTPARGVTNSKHHGHGTNSISTHTPARGVTPGTAEKAGNNHISTHTPARGVTRPRKKASRVGQDQRRDPGCYFYSHAREGRDANRQAIEMTLRNFYSHAREGRDHVRFSGEI